MFLRALIAFLVLPGVAAFLGPAVVVAGATDDARPAALGLVVLGTGCCTLLWCVREFYVNGKGTLAPWEWETYRRRVPRWPWSFAWRS